MRWSSHPETQLKRLLAAGLLAALLAAGCRPTVDAPPPPAAPPTAATVTPQEPADFTYDPATMQPLEEPPAHLTKEQRAQWWVIHNREQRRRETEAEAARQAELQRVRTQLEAADARYRQAEPTRTQPFPSSQAPSTNPANASLPPSASPHPSPAPTFKPVELAPADSRLPPRAITFDPRPTSGLVRIGKPRSLSGPVQVRGYYRKDGVYVRAHSRRHTR